MWCSRARVARTPTSWVVGDSGVGEHVVEAAAEHGAQQGESGRADR